MPLYNVFFCFILATKKCWPLLKRILNAIVCFSFFLCFFCVTCYITVIWFVLFFLLANFNTFRRTKFLLFFFFVLLRQSNIHCYPAAYKQSRLNYKHFTNRYINKPTNKHSCIDRMSGAT